MFILFERKLFRSSSNSFWESIFCHYHLPPWEYGFTNGNIIFKCAASRNSMQIEALFTQMLLLWLIKLSVPFKGWWMFTTCRARQSSHMCSLHKVHFCHTRSAHESLGSIGRLWGSVLRGMRILQTPSSLQSGCIFYTHCWQVALRGEIWNLCLIACVPTVLMTVLGSK